MLNYDLASFFADYTDDTQTNLQCIPNFNITQDFEIQSLPTDSFPQLTNPNISFDFENDMDYLSPFEPAKEDNTFFKTQDFRGLKLPPIKPQSERRVCNDTKSINISNQILNIINSKDKNILDLINCIKISNDNNAKSTPKMNLTLKNFEDLLLHKSALFLKTPPPQLKKSPPSLINSSLLQIEDDFEQLCRDKTVTFNPHKIGFIPTKYWVDKDFTFGELANEFFKKKNNSNSRFYHKLFNALKMSSANPLYANFIGVEWISEKVLKVDKKAFARLLGIKTVDGSLFHQQGNFPSHGFIEIGSKDSKKYLTQQELKGIDFEQVRLLIHSAGVFVRSCTENDIEQCKWMSSKKRL